MRRYLLLFLFLGFIGGWFILRYNPKPVFVEGVLGQPVDLIPGQGPKNAVDEVLERLLFRSLFTYDQEGRITPDLVESYSISKDGKVYDVVLKEEFWLDGQPITPTDVVFTFTQDPAFSDITIEQEGEKKLRFILQNPLSSFLDVLTSPVGPAHFRDLPLDRLGSSTFSIIDVKREGGRITEIRLENSNTSLKELIFMFFTSADELIKAAQRGEVDALISEDFSNDSFALYQTPIYGRYFTLSFNLESSNSLVKSKDFRKAATKKTPLVSGALVRGPLSGTWAQADLRFPTFSVKSLKKFKGKLTITYPKGIDFQEAAQKIASAWRTELGVDVQIKKVSSGQVDSILTQRDFEAIILGQEVRRDPDRYNLWHSSQRDFPGQNISGYADPRADRALEKGREVFARSKRKKHYTNFQRLFIEDNPAILLYHPNLHYWVSRKFTGLDLGIIFAPEERFQSFQDWKLDFEPR